MYHLYSVVFTSDFGTLPAMFLHSPVGAVHVPSSRHVVDLCPWPVVHVPMHTLPGAAPLQADGHEAPWNAGVKQDATWATAGTTVYSVRLGK